MSSFGERKIAPVSLHNLGKGSCYLGCETRRTGPHRPPRWPKWTVSGMQMEDMRQLSIYLSSKPANLAMRSLSRIRTWP